MLIRVKSISEIEKNYKELGHPMTPDEMEYWKTNFCGKEIEVRKSVFNTFGITMYYTAEGDFLMVNEVDELPDQ